MRIKLLVMILLSIIIINPISADENNPTKEEVAKLYVATFNRAPDSGGLNYWINQSGLKLSQIAQSFFEQTETQDKYPNGTTYRAFIQAVYNNLFNRDPDTGGWSYWEYQLNIGNITRNRFIEAVINGATDSDAGQDATILSNKTEVGIYFANAGYGLNDYPNQIMIGINANSATVQYIKNIITSGLLTYSMWDNYKDDSINYGDYNYFFILKNIRGEYVGDLSNSYQYYTGFNINNTNGSDTCEGYGFSDTFTYVNFEGVRAKYYYNIKNGYAGGCYEVDYSGSIYSGSNNYLMVYNLEY